MFSPSTERVTSRNCMKVAAGTGWCACLKLSTSCIHNVLCLKRLLSHKARFRGLHQAHQQAHPFLSDVRLEFSSCFQTFSSPLQVACESFAGRQPGGGACHNTQNRKRTLWCINWSGGTAREHQTLCHSLRGGWMDLSLR